MINNAIRAEVPARASLDPYRIDPFQRGCTMAATTAPGCTLTNFFRNGAFGATVPGTATGAAFGRDDPRTVVAARIEHDIDAQTSWRAQAGFDARIVNQPYYATAILASAPAFSFLTDLTRRYDLFGLPAVGYVALVGETLDTHTTTFNRVLGAGPPLGAQIGDQRNVQSNLGGRATNEVALSEHWTGLLGLGATDTRITGRNLAYTSAQAGRTTTVTDSRRSFCNVAPEPALH